MSKWVRTGTFYFWGVDIVHTNNIEIIKIDISILSYLFIFYVFESWITTTDTFYSCLSAENLTKNDHDNQ